MGNSPTPIGGLGTNTTSPDFTLYFNFEDWIRIRDSVFSVVVSLGFLWVVGLRQIVSPIGRKAVNLSTVRFGAALTAIGFVLSSLLFGRVRESRLFMPIAILFIPLTLTYVESRRGVLQSWIDRYLPSRLGKAVSDLTLDKLILAEAIEGNC